MQCIIWCQSMVIETAEMDRLVALEKGCHRRILLHVEDVHETLKKKKQEYFSHIIRGPKYSLLQNIVEGKMQERRCQDKRRTSWLETSDNCFQSLPMNCSVQLQIKCA